MMKLSRLWIFALLLLAGASGVPAETFQNSYISFELPPGWGCELAQTEWVCTDRAESPQSSAIIILTAKERGTIDRLDLYEDELSRPRPLRDWQPFGAVISRFFCQVRDHFDADLDSRTTV
jgi:hypothetical protein